MAEDPTLQDVPVVMVTSLTDTREQVTLPSDEYVLVEEWIYKPIDPDELLAQIKAMLG